MYIIPGKEQAGYYSAAIGYHVRVPALKELHYALLEKNNLSPLPLNNDTGVFASYYTHIPEELQIWWIRDDVWVEEKILGDRWQELLDKLDHDLPTMWSDLADADDVGVALDKSPYWVWFKKENTWLFVLLYEKRWDEALEFVQSWTWRNIDRLGWSANPHLWTEQEKLDNVVQVVTEYVNQHREQD